MKEIGWLGRVARIVAIKESYILFQKKRWPKTSDYDDNKKLYQKEMVYGNLQRLQTA